MIPQLQVCSTNYLAGITLALALAAKIFSFTEIGIDFDSAINAINLICGGRKFNTGEQVARQKRWQQCCTHSDKRNQPDIQLGIVDDESRDNTGGRFQKQTRGHHTYF